MLGKLRNFCTRETIFLSYSSKDSAIAEDIAQALKVEGHKVFFDKSSLEAGDGFGEQIRASIRKSDRFIFLVSRHSLLQSAYVKNELQQAESKWPSATRAVLPVQIDPDAPMDQLPPYLKVRHVHKIEGHVPAGVAALVAKTGTVRPRCWGIAAVLGLAILSGAWFATMLETKPRQAAVDIVLSEWETVLLEPNETAPRNPNQPNASTNWFRSATTITIKAISYHVRTPLPRKATLLRERIDLYVGNEVYRYDRRYVVDTESDACKSNANRRCEKASLVQSDLQEIGTGVARQTMFRAGDRAINWRAFNDYIFGDSKPNVRLVFEATLAVPSEGTTREMVLSRTCYFDFEDYRKGDFSQIGPKGTKTLWHFVYPCREQP